MTVELAISKYRSAKKAMTKHDREPTPAERRSLEGKLISAENMLLAAVGSLIGKKVGAV